LKDIIPKGFIRIKKGNKNGDLLDKLNKYCTQEFNYLVYLTDNDPDHKSRLDPMNGFCRYKDIITYKDNRVILHSTQRFINASWIHLPYPRSFIATQGPLPHTIEDFWTMCYEKRVGLIIMLCQLKEKNVEKCSDYWNPKKLNNFEIKKLAKKEENGLIIRKFKIINKSEKLAVDIDHYQLLCWEDHTALSKDYFKKIIALIKAVDQCKNIHVVHCSAGVGRTGTFICMYNLYHEIMKQIYLEKDSDEIVFSLFNLVRKIKEMRIFSVENINQFALLYDFANYLLLNNNSTIIK